MTPVALTAVGTVLGLVIQLRGEGMIKRGGSGNGSSEICLAPRLARMVINAYFSAALLPAVSFMLAAIVSAFPSIIALLISAETKKEV